ncbi:cupredoxin domain-containing protein [Sphingomonas edaphi]|nr:cupredoxin domain-containing protein [Sphingomonas edaphi]
MRAFLWAAVVAASIAPASAQQPAVVEIHLTNFRFAPNPVMLDHGRTYVLRLVNNASNGHDFTARDFFAASAMTSDERSRVTDGKIEVPPGQVREVRLSAPASGTFPLKCSHAFHKAFGMKGKIVVR